MAPGLPLSRETLLTVIDQQEGGINNSIALAQSSGWDHAKLVGVIKSLESIHYVTTTPFEEEEWTTTEEGEQYATLGSPEAQVAAYVKEHGPCVQKDIIVSLGSVAKIGFGAAMKKSWLSMNKATKEVSLSDKAKDSIEDTVAVLLTKSARIHLTKTTGLQVEKTSNFRTEIVKQETELTPGDDTEQVMERCPVQTVGLPISSNRSTPDNTNSDGNTKTDRLSYNLKTALARDLGGGHLHPLLKVKTEIRNILLLMGFEEMPTNRYLESSFWNFDALFQPQQHPARDAHDTFFITSPASTNRIPEDYMNAVKNMHEVGGYGSIGWRYDWSEKESRKNILRTHTTAVSTRVLYEMGRDYIRTGVFKPKKCFSIDRVFRNETLDATHLAEFHQVEGFVADRNLTLGNLIGVIREFFRRMGLTDLRFKPAYNPYTEPSMEIFAFHPMLDKWVEIGNSGIFRPEMVRPMGIPEDVSVIAWGLSVERPTMIQYGIGNIRELFGHKMDVTSLKKNPVCWLHPGEEEEEVSTAEEKREQ
ncbi:phenylalanyl-tRNA synthetase alpha chain, putative [Perkinsus marinus ATCC 50983]|uniref:phenylalanine--tRNA ligase n=1 Tax=Perkinsus marinus (strain ATCC 50983 / TXsc) TaxID=423536 RepID=C5LM70_PERM5|nr:phenylalanyl-tRNA synthetase alpha chain, putative [Perkinsus marinus ATCC 50983]EER02201.1 phenylalanyl-tRNA synthetase alpha chain, putative [Perkinsus marinus ATCC 50983]|eukprot:XP_002769483.1 phenylalanyl-tRNA synthetase alpha chain, putative [Perkinsus marinus ATCC 50983]